MVLSVSLLHCSLAPKSAIYSPFPCLFIFLSSFVLLSFFTSHFSSSVFAPLYIYFILSPTFSLMSILFSLTFPLSVSFSSSPAVINRCLVGCWSVRNGRSNGCSQLLQAFPGSPHCTALRGPGLKHSNRFPVCHLSHWMEQQVNTPHAIKI